MGIVKRIIKIVTPFMKDHGFRLYQNCFYNVSCDIAYCIEFEAPAGNLYVASYIMPLYIPTSNRNYTYGSRIRSIPAMGKSLLSHQSDDESIRKWCAEFCAYLRTCIFPVFKRIVSPQCLANTDEYTHSAFFVCPKIYLTYLEAFTNLYLGKDTAANKSILQFKMELQRNTFLTEKVKSQLWESLNKVAGTVMGRTADNRHGFFQDVIISTSEHCFGTSIRDGSLS